MFSIVLWVYTGLVAIILGLDVAFTIRDRQYSICGMKIHKPTAAERARWAAEAEAEEWNGWQEWADMP